mgnify:CR=1 FL=1
MRFSPLSILALAASLFMTSGCEDDVDNTVPPLDLLADAGPRLAQRDASTVAPSILDATLIQPVPNRGGTPGSDDRDDFECQPGETRCGDSGQRERCDVTGLWEDAEERHPPPFPGCPLRGYEGLFDGTSGCLQRALRGNDPRWPGLVPG